MYTLKNAIGSISLDHADMMRSRTCHFPILREESSYNPTRRTRFYVCGRIWPRSSHTVTSSELTRSQPGFLDLNKPIINHVREVLTVEIKILGEVLHL